MNAFKLAMHSDRIISDKFIVTRETDINLTVSGCLLVQDLMFKQHPLLQDLLNAYKHSFNPSRI